MNRKKGFSLTELLVVIAIIAIMVAMFTGAINPIAQVNKANDSKRKKDLDRIKISFEDYYNDENCYPTLEVIDELGLMDVSSCGDDIFLPWLNSWPCDPGSRTPYTILVEDSTCPDWFKIYANLANRNDSDIPENWYEDEYYRVGDGSIGVNDANYGVSSTNVVWNDYVLDPRCNLGCVHYVGVTCEDAEEGCSEDEEGGCFVGSTDGHNNCIVECRVSRCPL